MVWGPITKDVKTRSLGRMQIRIGDCVSNISVDDPVLTQANSLGAMATTNYRGTAEFHEFKSGFPEQLDGKMPLSTMAALECAFLELTPFNFALAHGKNPLADISAKATELGKSTTDGTTTGSLAVTDDGGVVNDTWMVAFTGSAAGDIYGKNTGLVHSFTDLTTEMAPDDGVNPYFSIPANYFSGTWAAGETYTFRTTAFVAGSSAFTDNYSGEIPLGELTLPEFMRIEAVLGFPDGRSMVIVLPKAQATASIEFDAGDSEVQIPITFDGSTATQYVTPGNAVWDDAPLGKIHFTS